MQLAQSSRRRSWLVLALAASLVCVASGDAGAVINDKVKKACQSDYKRLCPSYKVGSTQLRACMEAKQAEISSKCIDALIDNGEVDKRKTARR